jgi:hypothetical protein
MPPNGFMLLPGKTVSGEAMNRSKVCIRHGGGIAVAGCRTSLPPDHRIKTWTQPVVPLLQGMAGPAGVVEDQSPELRFTLASLRACCAHYDEQDVPLGMPAPTVDRRCRTEMISHSTLNAFVIQDFTVDMTLDGRRYVGTA